MTAPLLPAFSGSIQAAALAAQAQDMTDRLEAKERAGTVNGGISG